MYVTLNSSSSPYKCDTCKKTIEHHAKMLIDGDEHFCLLVGLRHCLKVSGDAIGCFDELKGDLQ
jgi:hypothetical protein